MLVSRCAARCGRLSTPGTAREANPVFSPRLEVASCDRLPKTPPTTLSNALAHATTMGNQVAALIRAVTRHRSLSTWSQRNRPGETVRCFNLRCHLQQELSGSRLALSSDGLPAQGAGIESAGRQMRDKLGHFAQWSFFAVPSACINTISHVVSRFPRGGIG